MSKAAIRRHHTERLKAKRRNYHASPSWSNTEKQVARYVNTPCPCSCHMCRNPRRSGWTSGKERGTMQERRFACVKLTD